MPGKIILSGGGNEKQTYRLDKVFLKSINKILYIPVAWKNDDFESCLKWFKNMISQHKKVEIDMLTDLSKQINLKDYDAVYIGGGNTFKLLKKIKESKFDKKLVDYYKNGGTIYGGSAGALIFGEDIKTALICKDKDVNEVKLKDTSGLNLIKNYFIQCHFEDNQIEEHEKFIGNSEKKIIAIPEESSIFVENNKFKVVGLKPVTIITKNDVKKYKVNEEAEL